jgi:hypothetical protein
MAKDNLKIITTGQRRQVSYNGWDQIRLQDNGINNNANFGLAEVAPLTPLTVLGAQNYWPLNETSGTTAYDALGDMDLIHNASSGITVNQTPGPPYTKTGSPGDAERAEFGYGYRMDYGQGMASEFDKAICPTINHKGDPQTGYSFMWTQISYSGETGVQNKQNLFWQEDIISEHGSGHFYVGLTKGQSHGLNYEMQWRMRSDQANSGFSTYGVARNQGGRWQRYSSTDFWSIYATHTHMVTFDWNDSGSGNNVLIKHYGYRHVANGYLNDYSKSEYQADIHTGTSFIGISGGKLKVLEQGSDVGFYGYIKDIVYFPHYIAFADFQTLMQDDSWRL